MSAATAWFLLDRGWRSSLVWIAGPLAAFNYLAVAAPADGITVLLSIGAIPVIGLLAWKFGVEPRVLLVLALCLLFGLASTALGMMLSIPYAGICSRSARWVCNLTGALLGGITAGLFCLSFWYASKRLTRPQERSA